MTRSPPPTQSYSSVAKWIRMQNKVFSLGKRRCISTSHQLYPRSGKISILHVLFEDLPVKQTFYILSPPCASQSIFTVIPLEIRDCPGNVTVDTLGASLADFLTIVFVIDIRDLYQQRISKLVEFIVAACQVNPDINFEVFVHKAERP
ncbi:hypothetical protein EDB19DRAFT_929835 [Suillus lakei]|nr:hypothetical protein EDB19DRAFT_929835 [Suillus lakei]